MVMPLDLFMTPYTDPSRVPLGDNSMAQFGQSLREESLRKQQLQQQKDQFQQTHALQTEETRGRNRYYEDLVDQRREASHLRNMEQKDKRAAALMDAFRKAKNAQERDLIRQELTRIGYSVEEGETDLPDVAAVQPGVAPPNAVAPAQAGMAPPVGPGGFRTSEHMPEDLRAESAMRAEIEGGAAGLTKNESARLSQGASGGGLGAFGIAGPAQMQKPKRGGRFTIRDSQGGLAQIYDEPMERERKRSAVSGMLQPYIGMSSNAEEKAAAEMAEKIAVAAIDGGVSEERAMLLGQRAYEKEMGRFKMERRPGSIPTGGGGGMSKERRMTIGQFSDDLAKIRDQVARDSNIKDIDKGEGLAQRGLSMLEGESGFTDGQALGQLMKELSGLTVSDAERNFIMGSEGKFNQLMVEANRIGGNARLPDDIRRGIRDVFNRAMQVSRERREKAGNLAYETTMRTLLAADPEERAQLADANRGYFTSRFESETPKPKSAGGGGARGGSPAPKSAAPAGGATDERKKKAIEAAKALLGGKK